MATYDAADLLARFNRLAGRPSADEITDAIKYAFLSDGQMAVIGEVAARVPEVLYNTPTALTTADNKVFTFGTDGNGYAVAPYGHVGVYTSLAAIPDDPWTEGVDYVNEGTQIRLVNDRSYGGTLYAQWVATPNDINASSQPSIRPAPARVLIVYQAVKQFGLAYGGQGDIVAAADALWQAEFPRWCLVWKTQFRSGGVVQVDPWGGASHTVG